MRKSLTLALASGTAGVVLCGVSSQGAVFQGVTGTVTWNAAGSWDPAVIPNAIGENATFNGVATGSNPAQTGNRIILLDGSKTVGSILFNTDLSNFTNNVQNGTVGPLVFDETGAGPAVITTQGAGTGNNTIVATMTLTDSVTANVNNTAASSAAGSLNLTGVMSGPGGFTKNGDGTATFGTGTKTYTGATVLNGGRTRISFVARPTGTSSFTINTGGQVEFISDGVYGLGSGTMFLNGSGPTTGPNAAFPGAIRNSTSVAATFSNAVELQSATLIHVQGSATGSVTFSNIVSGAGSLRLTAPSSDVNQGQLVLNGANTYSGGTLVAGGLLLVSGATATLGTGDVEVNDSTSTASIARLQIAAGVANAIADTASLKLQGGGTAGTADENFAILAAGINETVDTLYLGGVQQVAGTYGSSTSSATYQLNEYFSGDGIVTVLVPEPASLGLLALGGIGLLGRRRRH